MGFGLGSVLMNLGMRSESDQVSVDAITLFVLLLCTCIIIGHLLEKSRWINESITALTIGICTGIVLLLTTEGKSSHILVFNEEFFFIYLLPPIIFNAGFQVKKKQFFRNFMTITLFGVVGTLISFFIISLGSAQLFKMLNVGFVEMGDCFALGAIFSATDSVCTLQVLNQDETPLLYSLVFGEGVVNDATSVVLFNALQRFDLSHITSGIATRFAGSLFNLFFTSTLLGVAVGLLCAYIIKKLYFGRHSTDREVALMILMAYLSYMMAELFSLSGILTVFFCGIVMSHYTWHNVTENSRVTTKHAFATMSFISEIFIFLYVGMDALDIEKWRSVSKSPGTSVGVSTILLGLVVLGRAAFVFPLSFISNLTKKSPDDKISFKQQVTIWWAGLMRGAVSMALAYNKVFGLLTKPLIRFLLPLRKPLSSMAESEASSLKSLTLPLLEIGQDPEVAMNGQNGTTRPSSLRMLFTTPTHTVHYYWRKFDNACMRPVFGGRGFVQYIPGSPRETVVS
ncbi:sodium/hydrogen exchanger 1-like isoform X2 [Syzygium oleosum]|uniref:sodium/hydrogen exchanger 1-like isoform X2 n=1 Tax=Syzygium oleosum TaxID=219896 RepID=UPI0024BA58BC|nr:sodium/hydrogen exchanger 1-like isoform X2 [Syzygium oleosum]